MRKPVIALVGRPNVGKSTLFNALTRSRSSIVSDWSGLTRDRNYGTVDILGQECRIIDTGGLLREEEALIDGQVDKQARQAVAEADVVVFLVDGAEGLNAVDEAIAAELRRSAKPVIVAVNKSDRGDPAVLLADFYALALPRLVAISAEHRRGLRSLLQEIAALLAAYPEEHFAAEALAEPEEEGIMLAVLGRPNVGKSTLLNRLLGEERLVASPQAGTTRDSIMVPYRAADGSAYTLIDTAGIRRKSRTHEKIEKFSIVKALEAIERAHVVLLVLDAQEGISEQDAHLLGEITRRGRAMVMVINKWDGLDEEERAAVKKQFERKLRFVDYAEILTVSALRGGGVRHILPAVQRAHRSAMVELPTKKLNEALEYAHRKHQPPLVQGHSIKLQYAHQGGKNPPHIIIHGSRTGHVPASYTQYLMKFFRQHFGLQGTPIRISYRDKHNPYAS